eukprot:277204_1
MEALLQIDELVGRYYKTMGIGNYYNQKGNGLFLQFVLDHELQSLPISSQLGDESNPLNCKYATFDESFPLQKPLMTTDKRVIIFYILRYCYKYSKLPILEYIQRKTNEYSVRNIQIRDRTELTELQCNEELINCGHFERLSGFMKKYNSMMHIQTNKSETEFLCSEQSISTAINDYLHLRINHNTDCNFEAISTSIGVCDIKSCPYFMRNIRNRANLVNNIRKTAELYCTPLTEDDNGTRIIASLQILDKIHYLYQHAFDVGNILSIETKQHLNTCDDEDDSVMCLRNTKLIKLRQILRDKRSKIKEIFSKNANLNYTTSTKYNQLSTDDQSTFIKTNQNEKMYCFGYRFKYDERSYGDILIVRKYESLKQELIRNELATIGTHTFAIEHKKAMFHFNSDHRRQSYPHLSIEHILSLMVYCNFSQLQYVFSKTYRENINNHENHRNFYHLGKWIKQSVHKFGTKIYETNVQTFYHGISEKLLFPSIVSNVQIYTPLSTSISLAASANFADSSKGLVIEFNGGCRKSSRYLDVSWLSDYTDESEHLFIQNDIPLNIVNIMDGATGSHYKLILKSLQIIDHICIMSYTDKTKNNVFCAMISKIFENQLSIYCGDRYKPWITLQNSQYGSKLINTYFCNKYAITINFMYSKDYPFFFRIFGEKKGDHQWIKMDLFCAVFNCVESVRIFHQHLTVRILNDFAAILNHKHVIKSKLKLIEIKCNELKFHQNTPLPKHSMFDIEVNDNWIYFKRITDC